MPYILVSIVPEYNDEIYDIGTAEDFTVQPRVFNDRAAAVEELRRQLRECFKPDISTSIWSERDWSYMLADFSYEWYKEFPEAASWEKQVKGVEDGRSHWHEYIDWMEQQGRDWVPHVPDLVKLYEVEYEDKI